jgi:hypothetical protein
MIFDVSGEILARIPVDALLRFMIEGHITRILLGRNAVATLS